MSRCYPYPPPGYEKKTYVEPLSSPKKEKRKHKKKKRHRDSETNGDPQPRDKDKRSKKDHRDKDLPNPVNGSLSQTKAITSSSPHGSTCQVLQGNKHDEKASVDGALANNRKGFESIPNCMVDNQTPLISFHATVSSNGGAAKDLVPSSSKAACEIEDELSRQGRVEFMPHVEKVWSAVDDQEWLFLCDNQLRIGKKERLAGESPLVLTEAILLPSVGIYALPYVIPD